MTPAADYMLSFSPKRKAAALRRVKSIKRVRELVSQMRKAQPRRSILDPMDYDESQRTDR